MQENGEKIAIFSLENAAKEDCGILSDRQEGGDNVPMGQEANKKKVVILQRIRRASLKGLNCWCDADY